MRLTRVQVTGLFGVFDHTLNCEREDRVTIIHGPNGYGKTVMLNMIAGLLRGDLTAFETVPFLEFRATFSDGTSRVVRRVEANDSTKSASLDVYSEDSLGVRASAKPSRLLRRVPRSILTMIDRVVPPPLRLQGDHWIDEEGRKYSLRRVLDLFPDAEQFLPQRYRVGGGAIPVEDISVLFVETNRLRIEPETEDSDTNEFQWRVQAPKSLEFKVEQNSSDLKERINVALADYAKHSQDRDRTFPERLVRSMREGRPPLEAPQLLNRMRTLEQKRQRLVSLGILDSEVGLSDLTEEDVLRASDALTIYVTDVNQKLAAFDDLLRRIGTFRDILNNRLPYKTLIIDRDEGMRLRSSKGMPIRLRDLSSGEQHQLVVLYELLFRTPANGLVLVDEPEISLHVAWQSSFLTDLIEILQVTNSYAIVATHSPMIVGPRWDLTAQLSGPKVIASLEGHQ
jgi:predicted ATPase